MKKVFYFGLLEFLAILFFTFVTVSCGDDNGHPTPDLPDPQPTAADVLYKIGNMYDAFSLLDVQVTYVDGEGKEVTEMVGTPVWEKSVHVNSLPFTAKIRVFYTKKNNLSFIKDKYKIGHGISITYQSAHGSYQSSGSFGSVDVPTDRIETYLEKYPSVVKDSIKIE